MTEEQFGQWVLDNYNVEVEFDSSNATRTPDGMNKGEITVRREEHEKTFDYQWGSRVETPIPGHDIIFGQILTWNLYETDKGEAFDMMETPEQWEALVDEAEFFNTIFTEDEKAEIFNMFYNID